MFIKKPFSLISVEYSAGCWDLHDAMSAINVEMRKVVLPITCKYEKDVDKDSDSTKCHTLYLSFFYMSKIFGE